MVYSAVTQAACVYYTRPSSWLSSLVPNYYSIIRVWWHNNLGCLVHNPRIDCSSPPPQLQKLMNWAILMSPNRTKLCVYGYTTNTYIYIKIKRTKSKGLKIFLFDSICIDTVCWTRMDLSIYTTLVLIPEYRLCRTVLHLPNSSL